MDLTRPTLTVESGDPEPSLLTYLDALEGAYAHYVQRCDADRLRHTLLSETSTTRHSAG